MPEILSGGSADINSSNSLVPLLCVPGFPLVCSEQRKIEKSESINALNDRVRFKSHTM
jgi:hypothetical protein